MSDVLVLGGGVAGVAASVAAARQGAAVTLLEKNNFLGGQATSALVGTICGLYYRSKNPEPRYACAGFAREFAELLQEASGTKVMSAGEGLFFLPYDAEAFKKVCLELMDAENIQVQSGQVCDSLVCDDGLMLSVAGHAALTFVDCSGQAELSRLAGLELEETGKAQNNAFIFEVRGLGDINTRELQLSLIKEIKKAVLAKNLEKKYEFLSVLPGSHQGESVSFKWTLSHDTTLEDSLKKEVQAFLAFLKEKLPCFEKADIHEMATKIGVRSGKRPFGRQRLEVEDLRNSQKFTDGCVNATWPIEEWRGGLQPEMEYLPYEHHYEIPAGALRSKDISNLFFAGKSIAASDKAIASARVMGPCLGTGYAAGTLAAFLSQGRPLAHAIKKIRREQVLDV
jgi:hypothetical protein